MKYCVFLILLALTACGEESSTASTVDAPEKSSQPTKPDTKGTEMLTIKGTIVYQQIEGGFYGLDAEDGKKYQPHSLAKQYQQHGLIVEVTGVIDENILTFQQYGPVFKIKSVTILDDSNVRNPNKPNEY